MYFDPKGTVRTPLDIASLVFANNAGAKAGRASLHIALSEPIVSQA